MAVEGEVGLNIVYGRGALAFELASLLAGRGRQVHVIGGCARPADLPPDIGWTASYEPRMMDAGGVSRVFVCSVGATSRGEAALGFLDTILQTALRDVVLIAIDLVNPHPELGVEVHEGVMAPASGPQAATRDKVLQRLMRAHESGRVSVAVARACEPFGPRSSRPPFGEFTWQRFIRGKPVFWPGDPRKVHSFTFIPDWAEAMVRISDEPTAWGRDWNVPSIHGLSARGLLTRSAEIEDVRPPRFVRIPVALFGLVGLFEERSGWVYDRARSYSEPYVVSHSAYEQAFGRGPTPVDETLRRTFCWFASSLRGFSPAVLGILSVNLVF